VSTWLAGSSHPWRSSLPGGSSLGGEGRANLGGEGRANLGGEGRANLGGEGRANRLTAGRRKKNVLLYARSVPR
jgi:hypothetical protein